MIPTPRTDRFIASLPPIAVHEVDIELVAQIRVLMIAWADYARGLERELAESVPSAWLKDRKPS
jgi:hypothetical protein